LDDEEDKSDVNCKQDIDTVCEQIMSNLPASIGFYPELFLLSSTITPHINEKHLFMMIAWCKEYSTEYSMESCWKLQPETI
jgi:hypothetical protein